MCEMSVPFILLSSVVWVINRAKQKTNQQIQNASRYANRRDRDIPEKERKETLDKVKKKSISIKNRLLKIKRN